MSTAERAARRVRTAARGSAAASLLSWIFLGSNGIFLGGAGGLLGLLAPCLCGGRRPYNKVLSVVFVACVVSGVGLHCAAGVLGATALQFYATKPGSAWGPSLFGDAVHGAWWWVALSAALTLVNLAAAVAGVLLVRQRLRPNPPPQELDAIL
jgi:hypothetical protein